MSSTPISISVVMPAYNEEPSIIGALHVNIETFSSLGLDFEIIIINDASTDNTGEIGDQIARENPNVRCFHHPVNQGAGGAFKTGVSHATKEYIIFLPFDNPLLAIDLQAYLPMVGICDIIVGVRAERIGYSRFVRFASFLYNRILIPLLFNIGISDVNWIQIYRRHYFEDGTLDIGNTKIFFLVEILIRARENNLIIVEVPSKMKMRLHGIPTSTRFSAMWDTFWDMIKFFIKMRKMKIADQKAGKLE